MNTEAAKYFTWRRPGALGDIVLTMNLLRNFKEKYGKDSKVVYCCEDHHGKTLKDLMHTIGFAGVELRGHGYVHGKAFDLIGYPVKWNKKNPGNHPRVPMGKHLIEYFSDELEVEPDLGSFKMAKPDFSVREKFITMQVKSGWSPYKDWPLERWNDLCFELRKLKIPVYQIGGTRDPRVGNATGITGPDSTGLFNTCLSAIANAHLHMGIDSWGNHATNIKWGENEKRTHGVILWGSSQVTATGYHWNTNIVKGLPCQPCFKENPKMKGWNGLPQCHVPAWQTFDKPKHKCMHDITVKEVLEKVLEKWESA